jgi:hypothetical protein
MHKEQIMNWTEESARDEKLLGLLDLELLSQEIVAHGDGLAELAGEHNDRLLAMSERHAMLIDGRKRLIDFNLWADISAGDVLTRRCSLMCETWDWLQSVHAALIEREAILQKAQDVIGSLLAGLNKQRTQTVERLNKSMAKTKREMVAANPYRGAEHFIDILNNDDAVIAIDDQYAKLKSDLEWVADHRRRADSGKSTVRMRQEEVFKHLLN